VSNCEILTLIEKKRMELIEVVTKNGLNSTVAIQVSRELDSLLNMYNKQNDKQKSAPRP
jgi:Spo0E like sporulation regulatory protein